MRVLELFSGTGSIGKVFQRHGWEVVSLDVDGSFGCAICADIMGVDPEALLKEYGPFDVAWASPPCTEYSRARTTAKTPRDLEGADGLVLKAMEIIERVQPALWFIENPESGLLKSRDIMSGIPYVTVDYCRYGTRYRKRTAIWINSTLEGKTCAGDTRCPGWGGRHPDSAQRCATNGTRHTLNELHAIPEELCEAVYRECARSG